MDGEAVVGVASWLVVPPQLPARMTRAKPSEGALAWRLAVHPMRSVVKPGGSFGTGRPLAQEHSLVTARRFGEQGDAPIVLR